MVIKFDPCGTSLWVIVFWFCFMHTVAVSIICVRCLLRMFLCIWSLCIIYDWITIMWLNNHGISIINMLYSFQKNCHIIPLPPHNSYLSTMATFVCPQGGRCGEVRLYIRCVPWTYFSEFLVIIWKSEALRREIAAIVHYGASNEIALAFVIAPITLTALIFHSF